MKHLRRMFLKFARLFTNAKAEADLAREVAAHLTLLKDDYRTSLRITAHMLSPYLPIASPPQYPTCHPLPMHQ